MDDRKNALTEGPIWKKMLLFALPVFLGNVFQQFYNAFDAFLLPSRYEGLPVVGLESQSCGLPMFFSTAVTPEAAACELGHFIALEEGASVWAEKIIPIVEANIPVRRSYAKEVSDAGFDSRTEAQKMLTYYMNAIQEQN